MMTILVKDATGATVTLPTLPAPGQAARSGALPTTIATEDLAALVALPNGAATDAKVEAVRTLLAAALTVNLPTGAATDAKVEAVRALLAGTLAISASALPLPAGAATQTTLAAVLAALSAIGIAAGENHVGSFGSDSAHPSCTPAATALTYASGKCIGGLNTLTGFLRNASKSALIQSATLRSKVALTGAVDLVIFRDTPTIVTGLADGATFAVDPTEVGKVSKVISFTSWNSLGTPSLATLDAIGKYMTLANGLDAKCILVARAAIALTTASDLTASVGLVQD